MDDIVERLRESALEDAKCGWYDPAPRYTSRSMLLDQAADTIDRQREEIGRLREALTPSGETKAAYIGEFKFRAKLGVDEDGNDYSEQMTVPWTTVKEIMAAIRARSDTTSERSEDAPTPTGDS